MAATRWILRIACALLALVLMRLQNHNFSATVSRPFFKRLPITIVTAATLIAIDIFVLNGDIFHTLIRHLFSSGHTDPDVHQFVFKRLDDLLSMIWMAWLSAAVGEEIVFRMFLLEQIEKIIGSNQLVKVFACFFAGVVFGFGHAYQGGAGILGTSLVGLTFCAAYYLSRKNVVALILAHGIINTYWLIHLYSPN